MKGTRVASPRRWGIIPVFFLLLTLVLLVPPQALADDVRARGVILMNVETGEVLFEQDADVSVPPASLTKILSMYVAFDAVQSGRVSMDDQVIISERAAAEGGSRMGLRKGETVSFEKLILGMAVASGNDASIAVAEHVAGSEAAFIRLMNAKAARLGMGGSRFETVNGLPAQYQTTTARDMLNLSRYYLTMYPDSLAYHSTRQMIHNRRASTNKNPLLGSYEGADGLKTGWTIASGYNIVTTARRDDTRLVAVLLGCKNSKIRAEEIDRLMNAGFAAAKDPSLTVAQVLGVKTEHMLAGTASPSPHM